jgi:hypothetical protein
MKAAQRKAAKSATSLCVFINALLCIPCGAALKAVFHESLPAQPVACGADVPDPPCIDNANVQTNNLP